MAVNMVLLRWAAFASIPALAAVVFAASAEKPPAGRPQQPAKGPPLLLDDDAEAPDEADGPMADNSRCHHCHLNYVEEELALAHARAKIGCADCHGNCDKHIDDESWASGGNGSPPGIMYRREEVNPSCLKCHPKDKIGKLEHNSFFAGKAKEKHCTQCHGDHRLTERKCKWK